MTDLTEEIMLKGAFESRWRNIYKSSIKHRITPPDKEALWNKLLTKYQGGFKCTYCGQNLMIKDSTPPYPKSFSIDHKVSLYLKGNNSIRNLEIICHRCNIIKGTMTHETFITFIGLMTPELLNKAFKEIWAGRMADKLGREEMKL